MKNPPMESKMFNVVLIDNGMLTDHKIVDLADLDDVIEDTLDGLHAWADRLKRDLTSFSITIRDIHLGFVVAVIFRHGHSDVVTALTNDNKFQQFDYSSLFSGKP